ncbi:CVNH domain-containing protein [Granulicella sp. dw_53]|uniref:CVNH domain-containing protein n=1 Tax=Granulicella sp. dw_53 TaxID=2719792 RepID=UPI001BD49134|nr:CVNH domain-containing protein [Granulicella sp. dw_53]
MTPTSMLLSTALFVASFSAVAHAADPPNGSYRKTCGVQSFKDSVLTAHCKPENSPNFTTSQIDIRACGAEIFNRDGGLQCFARQGWGSGRAIPRGSYIDSCKNIIVANDQKSIAAQCKDSNGNYRSTQLRLTVVHAGVGSTMTMAISYAGAD